MNENECLGKVSLTEEKEHLDKFIYKCFSEDLRINTSNHLMPPYVEFFMDKSTEYSKLAYIVQTIKTFNNFRIVVLPDGGINYTIEDFTTPLLGIHLVEPIETDIIPFFDNMFSNLAQKEEVKLCNTALSFINICDMFANKESSVILRMQRIKDKCTFYVQIEKVNPNYSHITSLLKKAGMKLNNNISSKLEEVYSVSSNTFCVFESRLQEIEEILKNELNITIPEKEYDNMSFYFLARMKKRQLQTQEQYENFLKLEIDKRNTDWYDFQERVKDLETQYQNNG